MRLENIHGEFFPHFIAALEDAVYNKTVFQIIFP